MTAEDVVASLQRHLDPDVGSYWAGVYGNVKSIDKTGEFEVTVTLKKPDSMFNQYMAVSPGTVESAKTLKADGKEYGNAVHRGELHRAVRLRLVEAGREHHPEALRRLLGRRPEGQVGPGQVRLHRRPQHPGQRHAHGPGRRWLGSRPPTPTHS